LTVPTRFVPITTGAPSFVTDGGPTTPMLSE
jgi:hypothetical protein